MSALIFVLCSIRNLISYLIFEALSLFVPGVCVVLNLLKKTFYVDGNMLAIVFRFNFNGFHYIAKYCTAKYVIHSVETMNNVLTPQSLYPLSIVHQVCEDHLIMF